MALYWCNQPGCPGHHTFKATCPPPVVQDYPPLHSFIELLETQPIEVPVPVPVPAAVQRPEPDKTPAPAAVSSSNAKDYFDFWRE